MSFHQIASLVLSILFMPMFCFAVWMGNRARYVGRKLETTERAYAELIKGSVDREQTLQRDLKHTHALLDLAQGRMNHAECDADRLAPIVANYVKIIDETAALLKDETPPPIAAEREALRLHEEAVKFRTAQPVQPNETNQSN